MKLYRIEVQVAATGYIKAESREQAIRKAKRSIAGSTFEVGEANSGIAISALPFSDVRLPAVSLSPAMTVTGIHADSIEEA